MTRTQPTPIKATRQPNELAEFCAELFGPLEEIFNLVYIVRHQQTDSAQAKRYLTVVDERLAELREVVLARCNSKPEDLRKAS